MESAVKAAREIGGTQCDHPRGGQLDGQRYTVEALADLHNGTGVVVGKCEVGLHMPCPLDEEGGGIRGDQMCQVVIRRANLQRGQGNQLLSVDG